MGEEEVVETKDAEILHNEEEEVEGHNEEEEVEGQGVSESGEIDLDDLGQLEETDRERMVSRVLSSNMLRTVLEFASVNLNVTEETVVRGATLTTIGLAALSLARVLYRRRLR